MPGWGMAHPPKRPRNPNQLARLVVQIATGEAKEPLPIVSGKDPLAVELGRRGGLKGGKARSAALTSDQKRTIAQAAAKARWNKES